MKRCQRPVRPLARPAWRQFCRRWPRLGPAQSGLALVAVLWLTAALSLMVTGLAAVVRSEIRTTAQVQQAVISTGYADAAIRLTLQELLQMGNRGLSTAQLRQHQLWGTPVTVEVMPLNGLVNLNDAPPELLAAVFQHGAGLPADRANALAQALIERRQQKDDAAGSPQRMHSVDDLLQIPGIDYALWLQVSGLLTADLNGISAVNPLVAPLPVLRVLARGNEARAQAVLQSRTSRGEQTDLTGLEAGWIQTMATGQLLLRATVKNSDNTEFSRVWRVNLADSQYGLPWRLIHADPPLHASLPAAY